MARMDKVIVGPGRPWDLVLVCAVAVLAALLPPISPSTWLTWSLGFAAVFYCPGYAITSALLPGRMEILSRSFVQHQERTVATTMLERSALAVGLSAATISLAAIIMTRGLMTLDALSMGATIVVITLASSAIAAVRRSRLPPGDQFMIGVRSRKRGPLSRGEVGVAALILASAIMLGAVVGEGLMAGSAGMRFSEFEMTGADGRLEHLPSVLAPSQQARIDMTVTNHLGRSANYALLVTLEDSPEGFSLENLPGLSGDEPLRPGMAKGMPLALRDGETYSHQLTFSIALSGDWRVHLFLIDREGGETMELWLPIVVN